MPLHLTHLLQPLDVVVFQPLKHYHAKALDVLVRDGVTNISKLEFLLIIQHIRKQAFKPSTILSAFKKTSILPFNLQLVIEALVERQPARTPTPPPNLQSSPFSTPITLHQMNKVANSLEDRLYHDQDQILDPVFKQEVRRFICRSLANTTEMI
jgi:hypothetical protein